MNLLMIILIVMGLIVGACVFYVAWQLSSGEFETKFQNPALEEQPAASQVDEAIESDDIEKSN